MKHDDIFIPTKPMTVSDLKAFLENVAEFHEIEDKVVTVDDRIILMLTVHDDHVSLNVGDEFTPPTDESDKDLSYLDHV